MTIQQTKDAVMSESFDLTGIVSKMAELKSENDRLRRENESLSKYAAGDRLSTDVALFFLSVIERGVYIPKEMTWTFLVHDHEFARCPDWKVREAICVLLAKAKERTES